MEATMPSKIETFLAATLKEMNETSHPGRGLLLAERYNQVVRFGSYWDGGSWVRVADGEGV